jgi:hypothetical protein
VIKENLWTLLFAELLCKYNNED